jgi:WD40 repeat protein
MTTTKPVVNSTTPRTISPKPHTLSTVGPADNTRGLPSRQESLKTAAEELYGVRGRQAEAGDLALKPFRIASNNPSPSPTRQLSVRTSSVVPILPAVTIQSPQSPPKVKAPNLSLASASSYLSTDASFSPSPGGSSPRHFRIPSRPNTPLDPRRSPSLTASRPPSPPPPRRSGEVRRESVFKPLPPPVNRAEKPKIGNKPIALGFKPELTALAPVSPYRKERSSPFTTPPSGNSSPEHDLHAPIPRPRRNMTESTLIQSTTKSFEPPPVHHTVISKRKEQEINGIGRGLISPQVTGDQRPALPNRPAPLTESSVSRNIPPLGSMMPPPPRPSIDRTRPIVSTTPLDDAKIFATPPKRVFSTPTSQSLQTPPRSHGRSMTVDRTSDRTPAEFRTPPVTRFEPRQSLDIVPSIQQSYPAAPSITEYPDSTHSNRRPPHFKQGSLEISTKYDTRLVDVCGEFVCTSGHLTRVWNLLDGEIVCSLAHTEGLKIVSVSFKPTADVKDEGTRLWLGNNIGELMEVDVRTQSVVSSKASAHTRREVIKIFRHRNEMWTLDDGGTLHVWGPDSAGIPQLSNPFQSFRVPKGHTFSMVVEDELWHAAGKDIRIFMPTLDGCAQFQVLARPLNQPNTGDITSGTTIGSQPDRVYFGHTDGKVSIYSRSDFSCLGVVNVSVYRITTLAGESDKLWVGFSTGMIYIYDTTKNPWQIKKEWKAHSDPVIKLIADNSSFFSLDRAQVVSLGQDNTVRIWDGLLQDDWMGKIC